MKLKSTTIKNYRSIEEMSFDILELSDNSFTYGLIGINEAGKSSILKALALKDGLTDKKGELPRASEFRENKPIEILYSYDINKEEEDEFKGIVNSQNPDLDLSKLSINKVVLKISFEKNNPTGKIINIEFPDLAAEQKELIQEQLKQVIHDRSHKSLLWTAEDKYLITAPVNLTDFANDPNLSIPLKNSFSLTGAKSIDDIRAKIAEATESTQREKLREDLGINVTNHINQAWPGHKIKITFDISDGLLNFHVHDLNAPGKAKKTDQRSDGFGQFISFILSVSAQNANEELNNTLVLIDEPETHLHPTAQEDMLIEIIKLSQNNRNNIVFFATHSNYLIDKKDLSRNYRISKPNDTTEKEQLRTGESTYASVTYEVFEILSSDYHNQLYDSLRAKYENELKKANVQQLEFDNGFFQQKMKLKNAYKHKGIRNKVTLPTYVRNCIHYPDNKDNNFEKLLKESIDLLRSYEK